MNHAGFGHSDGHVRTHFRVLAEPLGWPHCGPFTTFRAVTILQARARAIARNQAAS